MQYKDEEILKLKRQIKEEEKQRESKKSIEQELEGSIYDETVYIMGEEAKFERYIIPELKMSIYMPDTFYRLSDDLVKQLFVSGMPPSHVYVGENIKLQVILRQTTHSVKDSEMKSFVNVAAKTIDAVGPKARIIEKGTEEKVIDDDVIHIGYVSFVSRAIDGMVFNIQFYVSIEGKILMGSVSFPSKYKKRLIPLAKEMVNSIELLEESEA